jgi:hypothetical protein
MSGTAGVPPPIHIHNHVGLSEARVDEVFALLADIRRDQQAMAVKYEDILAAVRRTEGVSQSAVTLLTTLAAELRTAYDNGDDDQLAALIDRMDRSSSELAAAVETSTPPAPTPGPTPQASAPDGAPADEEQPAAPSPAPADSPPGAAEPASAPAPADAAEPAPAVQSTTGMTNSDGVPVPEPQPAPPGDQDAVEPNPGPGPVETTRQG